MLTREDVSKVFIDRGFNPIETSLKEFINFQKPGKFGATNFIIVSICISPDHLHEYETAEAMYDDMVKAMQL